MAECSRRRARFLPYTRRVTQPTLTSLAKAGGCAAKYSAARLEALLAGIVPADATDLLVGLDPADDAAVYRLDEKTALVFTVDFFPPVVDDPRTFGRIAATNALNDVYAMGGRPLLALSVTAFPEELPVEMLGEVLAGAAEATREAGAILAGGHTIRDEEPKYGLAVVGTVHPDGVWRKSGARPGDAVLVTKSLGTGLVLQAVRDGRAPEGALDAAVASMTELNGDAADTLRSFSPNAVTDVTGFGLLGHAHETAAEDVRIELHEPVEVGHGDPDVTERTCLHPTAPCRLPTSTPATLVPSSVSMMWSATRSACATIVRPGFTAADEGKNEASTTKRLATSCARQTGSSTDVRGSPPKTSVPHWCVVFRVPSECLIVK